MQKYAVKPSGAFLKELEALPADVALEIAKQLKVLETAPLPLGKSRIKRLKGYNPPLYRLRVGDKRIVYRIVGNEVAVLRLIDRRELERELKRIMG